MKSGHDRVGNETVGMQTTKLTKAASLQKTHIISIASKSYIQLMNWEANKAQQRLTDMGQITVVVQDQGSVHTSTEVRQYYRIWESLGLYIFFLPKYCSQMNLIEEEWQRLKEDEIAGRMFEDEYDLAMAVIKAVDARAERRGYQTERFRFNYR